MRITINSKTAGKYRKETLNNRDHIVTEMISIVGDSVMNRGLYPLSEIEKSFDQIDNLPAPNGHPTVNGELVSAFHPLAINACNIGGFVKNPRMDGKRVKNEFWLDVEIADKSEDGKELVRRIQNGEEVGVSTGLTVKQEPAQSSDYDWIARDLRFDHVAILLHEKAAGAHVGTKLTVNNDVLIANCDGDQKMPQPKKGVGAIIEAMRDMIRPLLANATTETMRNALQAAVKSAYPEESFYAYVVDFDAETGVVYYEVCERDTGKYLTYQDSYTLENGGASATLGGKPAEVVRQVSYSPVGGGVSTTKLQEGAAMPDEQKPPVTTPNEADAEKAAVEAAIKLLESKGYKVATAEENSQAVANAAELAKFRETYEAELNQLRKDLVANSNLTDDDVKSLSKDALVRLSNSINQQKPQDFSFKAPAVRAVNAQTDEYLESYTTIKEA